MSLVVRAFPLRGSVEDLNAFVHSCCHERDEQREDFYRAHGVTHESWYLQETPSGPWVIGLTQVEDVRDSAPRFARSDEDFASWFKEGIRRLTGVDPATQPLGPPTQLVYQWSATEQVACNFAAPPSDVA